MSSKYGKKNQKELDEAVKIAERYEVFRETVGGRASCRHHARQETGDRSQADTQADSIARLAELEQRKQTATSSTQYCGSSDEHLLKKRQCDKRNNKTRTNRSVSQLDNCKIIKIIIIILITNAINVT